MADLPIDVATWRKGERARLLDARRAMPLQVQQTASAAIMRALLQYLHLPAADGAFIGFYWPIRREPDCLAVMRDLARAGGKVALPVVMGRGSPLEFRAWTEETKMEAGVWNIPQPAAGPPVVPAVLVVPLLGFDEAGFRLGYGAGYYDRTLAWLSPRPFTLGVGFESSRLPTIHPQTHDVPMDVIVTEERSREFHGTRAAQGRADFPEQL